MPQRSNLLTRNFVTPWPEIAGSFAKHGSLVKLWNDAGARLSIGVHLHEGTRLFRVFSGSGLVKITSTRGSMLHGLNGSGIINVPRGVILPRRVANGVGPRESSVAGESFSTLAVTTRHTLVS